MIKITALVNSTLMITISIYGIITCTLTGLLVRCSRRENHKVLSTLETQELTMVLLGVKGLISGTRQTRFGSSMVKLTKLTENLISTLISGELVIQVSF